MRKDLTTNRYASEKCDPTGTGSRSARGRLLAIVALGGALEFFDFAVFVFFADTIKAVFFPFGLPSWLINIQSIGLFAAGYVSRPLGGLILAHFGDLFGRKHVFAFSILLMAISSTAIAFLPTYANIGPAAPLMLLTLRVFQGIALGGEIPGAWTFVSEHVPARRIGLACGTVCAGLTFGILMASSIAALINIGMASASVTAYGWRLPFALGGASALVGVKLRRTLTETPVFQTMRSEKQLVPEMPLRVVLAGHCEGIVLSMLCTCVLAGVVIGLTLLLPVVLEQAYGITAHVSLIAACISTSALVVGVLCGGYVIDKISPGLFFIVGGALLAAGVFAVDGLSGAGAGEIYLRSIASGLSGAVAAGAPYVMVRSFPARVRYSGVSLSYNAAYAILGALSPFAMLATHTGGGIYRFGYMLVIGGFAAGIGVYLMVRPKVLDQSPS